MTVALCALLWALPIRAADDAASAPQDAGERSRIAAERSAVEAKFLADDRECKRHFVVTSCVDDARRSRRDALDALRARQLAVDEVRRHERAEERRREVAEKAEEDAKRDAARANRAAASGPASASSAARDERASGASSPASAPAAHGKERDKPHAAAGNGLPTPRPQEGAEIRRAREAKSLAAYAQRQAEAKEHRDESTAKTARRLAAKPAAASLPASAIPASAVVPGVPRPPSASSAAR